MEAEGQEAPKKLERVTGKVRGTDGLKPTITDLDQANRGQDRDPAPGCFVARKCESVAPGPLASTGRDSRLGYQFEWWGSGERQT